MKKSLIMMSLTAIAVSVPAISMAQMVTWGQLEVELGFGSISNTDGNANAISEQNPGSASLNGQIGADFGAYGVQADLQYTQQFIDENSYTGFADGYLGALHFNYTLSSGLALGIVGGGGQTQPAGESNGLADFSFYALEAAYDFGAYTVLGQVGAFDAEDSSNTDAFHDGTFVRLAGLYDLSSASTIEAELGYFSGKQDSGASYDMEAFTWGLGYNRQIGSRPMVWSVGVEGGHYSNGTSGDNGTYDETRVTLGLTMWFGGGSASDARNRAIFDTADFARIVEAGNNID